MNRLILSILFLALFFPENIRSEDVLHLKNGTVVRCEIVALTDNILTYKTTIDLGVGRTASAQPTIKPESVAYIEFGPLPGEAEIVAAHETAPLKNIGKLWDEKSKHLHRPRSNAGEIGLLYGERLLAEADKFQWDAAMAIFNRLLERDWNAENRKAATTGRLRAMIQLGRLDQATAEARELAKETEDPEMLIEARHAIALADFESLKRLETENPKWEEDDTVRPERERLYHSVLDQFLWPYLFHGTEEPLAARGLVSAAQAHRFAGNEAEAQACLKDVVALYPATPAAAEARLELAKADESTQNKPEPDDGNETNPEAN